MKDLTNQKFGKLTAIRFSGQIYKNGSCIWECLCDCGKTKFVPAYQLVYQNTKSCGCLRPNKDYTGHKQFRLNIIKRVAKPLHIKKTTDQFYLCKCDCGNEIVLKKHAIVRGQQSCGCLAKENISKKHWRGVGELSQSFFHKNKKSAEIRNIEFKVSIEELWELYIRQEKKCALSGVDLVMAHTIASGKQTASLDRIDSKKGYEINNIQWVHKDVNLMKQNLSEEKFINWTHLISKYNAQKKN